VVAWLVNGGAFELLDKDKYTFEALLQMGLPEIFANSEFMSSTQKGSET
jgi:hypothetical protein